MINAKEKKLLIKRKFKLKSSCFGEWKNWVRDEILAKEEREF